MTSCIIVFGGQSSEHRVSVASAQNLARIMPEGTFWFWAMDGSVHAISQRALLAFERPFENDLLPTSPELFPDLDAALDVQANKGTPFFLALHGGEGENGGVQAKLEARGIPFTGSSAKASALAFDKEAAKKVVAAAGVSVAPSVACDAGDRVAIQAAAESFLRGAGGAVLKPVADGSSAGLFFVTAENQLAETLTALPNVPMMVEPLLVGREITVGVVEGQGGKLQALPCSEVICDAGRRFDFAGKYLGAGTLEVTPADLPVDVVKNAQAQAIAAHRAIGCGGYSRTDFMVVQDAPVFLETNTLPGLTQASFIPQQLEAAGVDFLAFCEGQIELARSRLASEQDMGRLSK